eukprot:scaffold255693_cov17-Tisochrysis_lutea.AAC.2
MQLLRAFAMNAQLICDIGHVRAHPSHAQERPRSAPHVRQGSGSGSVGGASPEHTFKPVMNEMSREITDMSYPRD